MENDYKHETFFAKWLNGELTEEELRTFEDSPEYEDFQKIRAGMHKLKSKPWNKKAVLKQIKQRPKQEAKVWRLSIRIYAVAASIAITIGAFFLFQNSITTYSTDFGQQLSVGLPDGSKIQLNAVSEVRYTKSNWENDRYVQLKGEAFFEVEKGNTFTVFTENGGIEVLGTSFNVDSRKDFLKVFCHTGKVRVFNIKKHISEEISPNQMVIFRDGEIKKRDSFEMKMRPDWVNGISSFKETNLIEVISALERQYGIQFETELDLKDEIFTGSFVHDDRTTALKMVFESMNISYNNLQGNRFILK